MAGSVEIRRVRPDEWQVLRSLRLRALADAPMAFGSTLAGEQRRPEAEWRARAERGAAGEDRATYIVERESRPVGMATGLLVEDDPTSAMLVGVWIDPMVRGQGVGVALVETVMTWARGQGRRRLELWATESNAPAVRLYERMGFRPTGETEPLPHTPAVREMRMVRDLSGD